MVFYYSMVLGVNPALNNKLWILVAHRSILEKCLPKWWISIINIKQLDIAALSLIISQNNFLGNGRILLSAMVVVRDERTMLKCRVFWEILSDGTGSLRPRPCSRIICDKLTSHRGRHFSLNTLQWSMTKGAGRTSIGKLVTQTITFCAPAVSRTLSTIAPKGRTKTCE